MRVIISSPKILFTEEGTAMVDPPKKHSGERLPSYFDSFFKTIVGVSTFGASVTFSKIISTPVTPWIDYGFSKDNIQNYLAISWV
jgi:hypothetical protein